MRRMVALTGAGAAARFLVWVVCVLASANRAHAQCSARDVLQRQLALKENTGDLPLRVPALLAHDTGGAESKLTVRDGRGDGRRSLPAIRPRKCDSGCTS